MRKWTDAETETLLRLARERRTGREIAAALGRKPGSVWQKMQRIRQSGRPCRLANQRGLRDIDRKSMHPIVRKILGAALTGGHSFKTLGRQSGVSWGTIRGWSKSSPKIENVEAVANALGFKLVLVDQFEGAAE